MNTRTNYKTINDVLPSELLSTLFAWVLVLPGGGALVSPPKTRELFVMGKARSALSQVCSYWRSIVIHTPLLWQQILINYSTPREKVQASLARSKALPICVTLDLPFDGSFPSNILDLMDLLVAQVERWESFVSRSAGYLVNTCILDLFAKVEAPQLKSLIFADNEADEMENDDDRCPLFKNSSSTPKLRTVEFCGVPIEWDPLPLANIVHLSLGRLPRVGRLTPTTFQDLLRSSPFLESLPIRRNAILSRATIDISPPTPVVLPTLRSLTISSFENPISLNNTLSLFVAPNIKDLTLSHVNVDPWGRSIDFSSTFALLVRETDALKHVERLSLIYASCTSSQVLHSFYGALQNLRKLHVVYDNAHPIRKDLAVADPGALLFRTMIPGRGTPVLCQMLEEVKISGVFSSTLVEFASARASAGLPLTRVLYDTRDQLRTEPIAELIEMGVAQEAYEETEYMYYDVYGDWDDGGDNDYEDWTGNGSD